METAPATRRQAPATRRSLLSDLRSLDVVDGDALMVHASVRRIGAILGGVTTPVPIRTWPGAIRSDNPDAGRRRDWITRRIPWASWDLRRRIFSNAGSLHRIGVRWLEDWPRRIG